MVLRVLPTVHVFGILLYICSIDNKVLFCLFHRAMNEQKRDVPKCIALLHRACDRHQTLYRDAMCGRGVDRHLFGLFVICKGLGQVG